MSFRTNKHIEITGRERRAILTAMLARRTTAR